MDIFDGLLATVAVLLHWRIALCFVTSACLAVWLVVTFSWVGGLQGFLLVALGFFAGACWQGAVGRSNAAKPSSVELQAPQWLVPALALAVGVTLGLASWTSRGAMIFGGVLLVLAGAGWAVYQGGEAPKRNLRLTLPGAVLGFVGYAGTLVSVLRPWLP